MQIFIGGPLTKVINNQTTLIGIISFGADNDCSNGTPTAYARVSSQKYIDWILLNSDIGSEDNVRRAARPKDFNKKNGCKELKSEKLLL